MYEVRGKIKKKQGGFKIKLFTCCIFLGGLEIFTPRKMFFKDVTLNSMTYFINGIWPCPK